MPTARPSLPNSQYTLGHSGPDAYEQMMVELINRARLDPTGEVGRQSTGFASGVTATPKEALAVSHELNVAAQNHSDDMLARNYFAHNSQDGTTPFQRMQAAGYNYSYAGENIGWIGSYANAFTQGRIQSHHNNLWDSAGHQRNLMSANYSEVGIGFGVGGYNYNGTTYPNSSMLTQNFGDRGRTFLTGVVIDDQDDDDFYDVGEGLGDVRITAWNNAGSFATSTWDAGGYTLDIDAGTYFVTFEGGDLTGSYTTVATVGSTNVKLDVTQGDGRHIVSLSHSRDDFVGLSRAEVIWGRAGHDTLNGAGGGDTINGNLGNDTLIGQYGNDKLYGGSGSDKLKGGNGRDVLHGNGGRDVLNGGLDNDKMYGDAGNDSLFGGAGNDWILGGTGNDRATGGQGTDNFVFRDGHGGLRITDFTAGEDRLRLDDALWGGGLSVAQVLSRFGDDSGADFVLDFGNETVTLDGIDTAASILGDVLII